MEIKYLHHKHGGRITDISEVGHDTYKGVAEWFYVGTVEWSDGSKSMNMRIAPYAVCYDHDVIEARQEYDHVSDVLTEYLGTQGKWHERTTRGSWRPKSKTGSWRVTK
jgi:hypothetical protein